MFARLAYKISFIFFSYVFLLNNVQAIGSFHPEPEQLKLLPPYCTPKARSDGNNSRLPDVKKWQNILGSKNYSHIHHYCIALLNIHKSKFNKAKKDYYQKGALGNINYSLKNSTSNFILLPELYLNMGKIYKDRKEYKLALKNFSKSIAIKNDYIPGYLAMVKIYIKFEDYSNADRVLKQGLKYKPDSKILKRYLKKVERKIEKNNP